MDVKNTFHNGGLKEEVYMKFDSSLENKKNFKKVSQLKKSVFDIKQSSREFLYRLIKVFNNLDTQNVKQIILLFVKHSTEWKITIIIVHVDDIILTRDNENEITNL